MPIAHFYYENVSLHYGIRLTCIAFSHIPYLPGRLSLVGNATLRVGLQGPSRDMKGSARIVTSVVSIIEGLNYIGIGHIRM